MTERKVGAMRNKASYKDVLAEGGREGKEQYRGTRATFKIAEGALSSLTVGIQCVFEDSLLQTLSMCVHVQEWGTAASVCRHVCVRVRLHLFIRWGCL